MKDLFKIKTIKKYEELTDEDMRDRFIKNSLKYKNTDGSYKSVECILKLYFKEQGMTSEEIYNEFARTSDDLMF